MPAPLMLPMPGKPKSGDTTKSGLKRSTSARTPVFHAKSDRSELQCGCKRADGDAVGGRPAWLAGGDSPSIFEVRSLRRSTRKCGTLVRAQSGTGLPVGSMYAVT
jgi:hypothetical protein